MAATFFIRVLRWITPCFALLSPIMAAELQVATFQADVTPALGTPIYSGYKPLATIEHRLLAKGVVLQHGRQRYVLCAVDWCELCDGTHTAFREKLAEAVGTNVEYVAVQTVHQHNAPIVPREALILLENSENPPPHPPLSMIDDALANVFDAARASVARFEPCDRIGIGQAKVDRVASTRRNMVDGKIVVRFSAGAKNPSQAALPEGKIDPYLKTITFAHGERPIARLHYYAVHPQSFYGDPRASYDFPGMARERLQEKEGVFQVYFTGCSGDVTAGKYNDGSPEIRQQLADRMQEGMETAIAATEYRPAEEPIWRREPVQLPPKADPEQMTASACKAMARTEAPASSRIYSGAMALAFLARLDTPLELSSLQIGNAYIVHLPGESMIEYQLYAQRQRPNAWVAVAAYGDCGPGYICTAEAFEEGGYEPSASHVGPGSESIMKAAIQRLLGVPTDDGSRRD